MFSEAGLNCSGNKKQDTTPSSLPSSLSPQTRELSSLGSCTDESEVWAARQRTLYLLSSRPTPRPLLPQSSAGLYSHHARAAARSFDRMCPGGPSLQLPKRENSHQRPGPVGAPSPRAGPGVRLKGGGFPLRVDDAWG